MTFYVSNSASGAAEGDPARLSWQSVLFYVRAMEGYQLFLPLFALFIVAIVRLARNYTNAWTPIVLWILGGWLGLLLLENKDPRYAMPFLPAVAIVTAKLFERRTVWIAPLMMFLLFQHFTVSFGMPWLPDEVVLAEGPEGQPRWNWNLYTQSYAGLWGKPINADWRVDDVIEQVSHKISADGKTPVTVGLLPDIPSFDAQAFEDELLRRRAAVTVNRVAWIAEEARQRNDYLLTTIDESGYARIPPNELDRLNRFVTERPGDFELVDSFRLPAGATIRFYKLTRTSSKNP